VGVVEDIGRFIAYALLLYMAFGVVTTKLVASSQRAYVREQHKLVFTLGFAVAAVWSLGIFVAMWPITGAMSLPLLVVAALIPVAQITSDVVMPKLLRVKRNVKSSLVTAMELSDFRHAWAARATERGQTFALPVLLLAGLLVLILEPSGDRQDAMFRFAFGGLFLLAVPHLIRTALIIAQPVLDNNSRDGYLAGGIKAMVTQIILAGLILSSLDIPRTDIPLGLADASLSVSVPVLGLVIGLFLLATVVPYAIGIRAHQKLRTRYVDEETSVRDELTQLLLVPRSEDYDDGLASIRTKLEAAATGVQDEYFYVKLRRPTTHGTTAALAEAIDEGVLVGAATTPATAPSDRRSALPDSPVDFSRVQRLFGRTDPFGPDGETVNPDTQALSYGEVLRTVADHRGWDEGDLRLGALAALAHSFEHDARFADPALVHFAWLERMRDRVDEIHADLANRDSTERREQAAQLWSNAVAKEEIELGQASAGGSTPGGVILLTTLVGLAAAAVG
jgi:hypothetical protein